MHKVGLTVRHTYVTGRLTLAILSSSVLSSSESTSPLLPRSKELKLLHSSRISFRQWETYNNEKGLKWLFQNCTHKNTPHKNHIV